MDDNLLDRRLRISSMGLAALGFFDAAYLTWVKFTDHPVACIQGLGNCNTVQQSSYSVWNGIPIALLGALAYLVIIGILYFENKLDFLDENARILVLGLSLIGFIYSGYLTYLELNVIKAICPYCVGSAIMMTLILILTIVRLLPVSQK